MPGSNAVISAPDGAYSNAGGQGVFTHGVQIGIARNETHDLRTATDEFVASLAHNNPKLSRPSGYDRVKIGGRQGLRTAITNVSEATGQHERIAVFTALLADGSLLYLIGVAPLDLYSDYDKVFRKIVGSIEIIG